MPLAFRLAGLSALAANMPTAWGRVQIRLLAAPPQSVTPLDV